MKALEAFSERSPVLFVVGLFIVDSALAVPFVLAFRLAGLDVEPLRLIIPILQSAFMVWLIGALGWVRRSGFTLIARELHVYVPVLVLALVPVMVYGTVEVEPGPLLFYTLAVLFTGISEEAIGRGVAIPVLLPKGKGVALGVSSGLFSVAHFSNLAFADVSPVEMAAVLLETFSFGILYGAVFLRTGSILLLIVLHTLADYLFLTSGSAGPFLVQPMGHGVTLALAVSNLVCGLVIVRSVGSDPARSP